MRGSVALGNVVGRILAFVFLAALIIVLVLGPTMIWGDRWITGLWAGMTVVWLTRVVSFGLRDEAYEDDVPDPDDVR